MTIDRELAFLRALQACADWLISERLNDQIAQLEALKAERAA